MACCQKERKKEKRTRHAVLKEHNACWGQYFCLTFYPLTLTWPDVFTPVCAKVYVLMHMLKSCVSV